MSPPQTVIIQHCDKHGMLVCLLLFFLYYRIVSTDTVAVYKYVIKPTESNKKCSISSVHDGLSTILSYQYNIINKSRRFRYTSNVGKSSNSNHKKTVLSIIWKEQFCYKDRAQYHAGYFNLVKMSDYSKVHVLLKLFPQIKPKLKIFSLSNL